MRALSQQVRLVFRKLYRTPPFTLTAVITLSLGIGANTALFSVVNGVLPTPLPCPEPNRLVGLWHTAPGLGVETWNQSLMSSLLFGVSPLDATTYLTVVAGVAVVALVASYVPARRATRVDPVEALRAE